MKKITTKNKLTKLISSLIIIAIIAPSIFLALPQKANAFWGVFDFGMFSDPPTTAAAGAGAAAGGVSAGANVTVAAKTWKDVAKEIAQQVLMSIAQKLLQQMTKSTVNWINSGFHGAPLFLENPDSFFKDVVKSEIKTAVNLYGYDLTRFPFGKSFALNTIYGYKRAVDSDAAYSLGTIMNNPAQLYNYQNNFNYGGWNAFLINTQYPQNTYLGFQMIANRELAKQIQTPIQKIQETLDRGQGFLSPQNCPSNPAYNNGVNEFKKPAFDAATLQKKYLDGLSAFAFADDDNPTEEELARLKQYREDYTLGLAMAKAEWNDPTGPNVCPGGLVNTTPGAVVANQIMTSLGSGRELTVLGATMGNSISAVVNSLLQHFLDKGLNSLASTINPPPEDDNFSYDNEFLDVPADNTTNATWDSGPDQPIVLNQLKKELEGQTTRVAVAGEVLDIDIDGTEIIAKGGETIGEVGRTGTGKYIPGTLANTQAELALMDNDSPGPEMGITQWFGVIWPLAQKLDTCIPGPDLNWQDRLVKEKDRIMKIVGSAGSNGGDPNAVDAVSRELELATKFFKDWVNNKMITELPSSISYMDAVANVKKLSQQANELIDAKRVKGLVLARLKAIDASLNTPEFATQPRPGTQEAADLVAIWKQYQSAKIDASNSITVENRRNEQNTLRDQAISINKLLNDPVTGCLAERRQKGWSAQGGPTSVLTGASTGTINGIATNSEQALFCDIPIIGGYSHGKAEGKFLGFNGPNTVRPELPVLNTKKVLSYKSITIKSILSGPLTFSSPSKTAYVDVRMSCNTIFNANALDYKGDLPGYTNASTTVTLPDDTINPDAGVCTYTDGADPNTGTTKETCLDEGGSWTPNTP